VSRPTASRRKGRIISVSEATREETCDRLTALFGRVISGEQAAFAEFYDSTASRVHGIVERCLIDYSQSEEVTQEVYLEIWRKARSFDRSKGEVLGWIFTIGRRSAIDRVRASYSARNRDNAIGFRDRQIEFDSVSEAAEVHLEQGRAKEATAVLTSLQRETIELVHFDGSSDNEVAEGLGLPVNTVKSRMTDGLVRMRKKLTEGS
jgi:RNA polymerase sigma-70 factor, ECF subfamily